MRFLRILHRLLDASLDNAFIDPSFAFAVGAEAVAPVIYLDTLVRQGKGLIALPEVAEQAAAHVNNPRALVACYVGRRFIGVAKPQSIAGHKELGRQGGLK